MRPLRFYEVVEVGDGPQPASRGVAGATGIVLGISAEGDTIFGYAVYIGDRTYTLDRADLSPTGRSVKREDIYDGTSIRIAPQRYTDDDEDLLDDIDTTLGGTP